MAELVEGVDVVSSLIGYLAAELPARGDAGPVASRQRSGGGVTITDTGGPGFVTRVTDSAQITIDVRRPTEGAAWSTVSLVRALVYALAGTTAAGVTVQRVDELARPTLLPDPNYEGARYRWSAFVNTRARIR